MKKRNNHSYHAFSQSRLFRMKFPSLKQTGRNWFHTSLLQGEGREDTLKCWLNFTFNILNYFLCSSHPSPGACHLSTNHQDLGVSGKETRLILQSNDKFIRDIRKRLDENAVAREQREKRLQRFMIEQMKAREAQEVKIIRISLIFFLSIEIIMKSRRVAPFLMTGDTARWAAGAASNTSDAARATFSSSAPPDLSSERGDLGEPRVQRRAVPAEEGEGLAGSTGVGGGEIEEKGWRLKSLLYCLF